MNLNKAAQAEVLPMSVATLSPADSQASAASKPAVELVSLCGLRAGEGRVVRVDADGDDAARLQALGICVGRRLHVVRGGDPMIVCVIGARVGLSARLASRVLIAAGAQPAATNAA